MRFHLVHELPGRMRIYLSVRRRPAVDQKKLEAYFHGIPGMRKVSFSPRTQNLLLEYEGSQAAKEAILSRLGLIPRNLPAAPEDGRVVLHKKKRAVLVSGLLLLAAPLIPWPPRRLLAFWGALPIFKKGFRSIVHQRRFNVDVLDSSAIGVAMTIGEYRTAGVISFLLKLGDYIEEWTKEQSRQSISEMFGKEEEWAWVEMDGVEKAIPVADICEGDAVITRTGQYIPVDGIVTEGEALVNQSSMTGESMPVMKKVGVMIYAGTAIEEGSVKIKALRVGDETRTAKIVTMILESETFKTEAQSYAEKLADQIVPYSFGLSLLTYVATGNPVRAASVLLVDYSCAIKISAPLSILSAMMTAARQGILIKGGKYIEKLAKANALVFDKTGTLTTATPRVVDVVSFGEYARDEVLRQAACVEEHFPHPVATSIVKSAAERGLLHQREKHQDLEYVLVHGISSRIDGNRVLVGSRHFICEDEGVDVSAAENHIDRCSRDGCSILYVAIGGRLAGIIAIEDPIRDSSEELIRRLRDAGVEKIVMLTGDGEATAKTVAGRLGIADYHAQVFPDRKLEVIHRLKREGYTVVMVGDGINDSPALSYADVGISTNHSADIAKEAANVVLLDDDLMKIAEAKKLSERTMKLINQNFRYLLGVNSAILLLGLSGMLPAVLSAAAHNLTTLGIAANLLKLWRSRS